MARKRSHRRHEHSAPAAIGKHPEAPYSLNLEFSRASLAGVSLGLLFATLLIYLPVTSHPFLNYDDRLYITENSHIQVGLNLTTLKWAATSIDAANWHPLTWLAHATVVELGGLDAGDHHAANVLFHLMNVVLVFLLLAIATKSVGRSLLVAALFAVHPLDVESVAWAAELKNVLSTLFFLLTIGSYGWYARKPAASRYALVVLLFLCGLSAKPMVITLPFVLLLLDFWPLARVQNLTQPSGTFPVPQRVWFVLVLEKVPLLAMSAASAWVTIVAQKNAEATTVIHSTLGQRLANALVAYATYIRQLFIPVKLAVYYPFPVGGIPAWEILVAGVLFFSVSLLVFRYARERHFLLVGCLWFFGTLVPVIGLLQVGGQAHADRYTYIPMMGFFAMVVWGIGDVADKIKVKPIAQAVLSLAILAALAALTLRQIGYWSTSSELWTHTIAVTGDNATAEINLSLELIRLGRIDEAATHLQRAIELDPDNLSIHVNLGNVYSLKGMLQETLHEYGIVLERSKDPKLLLPVSLSAASEYIKLGDVAEAEKAYRLALKIAPDNAAARRGLSAAEHAPTAVSAFALK